VPTLLSRYRRILLIIVVALVLGIIVTLILQYTESTQIESLTLTTTITISNETVFSLPYEGFVKKGYFDSVATVYVYLSSPYANCWKTFNVWMSLDNSSWLIVPFLESTTNNYSQMANLGFINLGNPQLTIYQKHYVPPQTVLLPPNATAQDASNLTAYAVVKKQAIPADTIQWILVFFAVFGAIGFILSLFFSGKDSNFKSQNIRKSGKKTSRTTNKKKRKNIKFLGSLNSALSVLSSKTSKGNMCLRFPLTVRTVCVWVGALNLVM
jgi:hypothetical protein